MPSTQVLPTTAECDVLVVGGGAAGIAAAIASARSGARTVLLERYGFLGGMATTALVGAFCGLYTTGEQKEQVVRGILQEFLERLRRLGGLSDKRNSGVDPRIAAHSYDPELFKYVAEQMVLEADVELQLHTLVVDHVWEEPESQLRSVVVENKSGRSAVLAKQFIDASGDADVAARAGVPFELGDGAGGGQALTTIFRLTNVGLDGEIEPYLRGLGEQLRRAKATGRYRFERVDPVVFPALPVGTVSVNVTSIPGLDATKAADLTAAEIEGRRQVFEYLRALREFVPGFAAARLMAIAPQVGVRETRRVKGEYVLSDKDVLGGAKPEDGIALGAWPVEIHNPETKRVDWRFLDKDNDCYAIPFRCLVPRGLDNLLVAGRCASTTHVAQASTRVMAQAFAMGEAAGVATGLALSSGTLLRRLAAADIRRELEARGAIVNRLPSRQTS